MAHKCFSDYDPDCPKCGRNYNPDAAWENRMQTMREREELALIRKNNTKH